MNRRHFLKSIGVAGAAGLAGCINRRTAGIPIGDAFSTRGASVVVNGYTVEERPRATLSILNTDNEPLSLQTLFDSTALRVGRQTLDQMGFADETSSTELVPGELLLTTVQFEKGAPEEPYPAAMVIGDATVRVADADGPIDGTPTATFEYSDSVGATTVTLNDVTYEVVYTTISAVSGQISLSDVEVTNNGEEPVQFDEDDLVYKDTDGRERRLLETDTLTQTPLMPEETRTIPIQRAPFGFERRFVAVDRTEEVGTKRLLRL